jgi:ribosomal silencing factor RsfS
VLGSTLTQLPGDRPPASDAKATDVVVLGIRDLAAIADYFVICTAR